MHRTLLACLLVAVSFAASAAVLGADDDEAPFRPGTERRTWKSRPYDLILPKGFDGKKPLGLVVVVLNGGGYEHDEKSAQIHARAWERFVEGGWAACVPKSVHHRDASDSWSTSEAPDLSALARHVAARLGTDERRVHFVATNDVAGFARFAAFDKDAPWRSVCFDGCSFAGGTLPERAKSMGTLVVWDATKAPAEGHQRLLEALRSGARSVDSFATGYLTTDPQFLWWIEAMDGRFVPGRDRSLAWADAPADAGALAALASKADRGAVVWFHAPADRDAPAARALQLDVLFDPAVRAAGSKVLAFRAPLAGAAGLAKALGVSTTPALVVVDAKGATTRTFSGEFRAADVAKALKAVAGK